MRPRAGAVRTSVSGSCRCPRITSGLKPALRTFGWLTVSFQTQQVRGDLGQPFHADAVMAEDVGLAPGDRVLVGDADDSEGDAHARLEQRRSAGFTQAPVDEMLLDRDHG